VEQLLDHNYRIHCSLHNTVSSFFIYKILFLCAVTYILTFYKSEKLTLKSLTCESFSKRIWGREELSSFVSEKPERVTK